MRGINHHFSRIAHKYRDLRTIDLALLSIIKKRLENLTEIEAADVGCGAGRKIVDDFEIALRRTRGG